MSIATESAPPAALQERSSAWGILLIFLRLGLTSFGGPIAHLGYFREEFVARKKWLDDAAYADLVSLCQFLPGPASSQVGIGLGLMRGGVPGALAAWLGFTLPSALALIVFALFIAQAGAAQGAWLHGLKVVAVAVVAQALWGMGKSLCPDRTRASIAVAAAIVLAVLPGVWAQVAVIIAGGILGRLLVPVPPPAAHQPISLPLGRRAGAMLLVLFFALLLLLPLLAAQSDNYMLHLVDGFYRAGALVFGGGHVVLPLLQAQVVPTGWVSNDQFLAGYGAAQAVPGPLFTFAAYLGAASSQPPHGWLGGLIALLAIFLPAFLLVLGALPWWEGLRRHAAMRQAMQGVNAAVVGVLLAAFYQPVWTSAILSPADFVLAAGAFLLLVFWKAPPWLVVLLCGLIAGLGWR